MVLWTIVIVLGFMAVHLFKMARLYLVLMEHKISFGRFILLYFRTTFINLIIPFKLGEVYRVEEIARETRVWQVGLLSVLVDRYFDTVALFMLLLPFDLFFRGQLSVITVVFLAIIVIVALLYLAVPSSYTYLNRYLIMKKSSSRSLAALKSLDVVKKWYDFAKDLISGRYALIVAASLMGWISEVVALKALASFKGLQFGFGDFASYIEAIFMNGNSQILTIYTGTTAFAFLVLTVIGYVVALCLRGRRGRR
ncbi:MAG: flippase-like domain-containing protein [Lachnospiraceae bacterium]|nr:flippase-like domain-containing protein [Lachnospiraceae bacterium]